MSTQHIYATHVQWKSEKIGNLTSDGFSEIEVATPVDFGGHEGIWSPEHLFVASANVCFMTTFLALAPKFGLKFHSFDSDAIGKVEKVEGKGFEVTEIMLKPKVVIEDSKDEAKALKVLAKSEKYCLISNSMKSEILMEPEVIVPFF
ncbi:MAG: OsmC family peroxiredoxin [Calditrichaeota bacterium]|nr:MAG: OsmC family peroxiredoxin [Calditrichota bacterium]